MLIIIFEGNSPPPNGVFIKAGFFRQRIIDWADQYGIRRLGLRILKNEARLIQKYVYQFVHTQ